MQHAFITKQDELVFCPPRGRGGSAATCDPIKKDFSLLWTALLTVGWLLFTGPLAGQTDTGERPQREPAKVAFTCLLWEGPLDEQLFYRDGASFLPVKPAQKTRSAVCLLEQSSAFALYVKAQGHEPGAGGEGALYHLVGRCPLLPGTGQILFILFQEESGAGLQLRIHALDDSQENFPAGTFHLVNFSEESLQVTLAETAGQLLPQAALVVASGVTRAGGMVPFTITNEQDERIFETRFFAQERAREIVFISSPSAAGKRPKVRFLPQLIARKLPARQQGQNP